LPSGILLSALLLLPLGGEGEAPPAAPEAGVEAGIIEKPLTPRQLEHWAYRPLSSPEPPEVLNGAWVENPIDRFVLARLEWVGLEPMPEADRETLIRRLSHDLTGLAPSTEEVDAFLDDRSPDAYERLLDRLLASLAYGERWAQHWLDLARFAETDGFEHDLLRPNAWRYRDWVIAALDRDLPYDEFVRLQLAGDELRPGDPEAAVATGFALSGPDMPDINLQEERRHTLLNEMTGTVGAVFLGLQIGCAQCHDHKFDALSQADFYRLRAIFEPADILRDHPVATAEERALHERALAELEAERARWKAELEALEKGGAGRPRGDIEQALARLEAKKPALAHGRVLRERDASPPPSHLMIRGSFRRPGPEVSPAFPRIANPWGEAVPTPAAGTGSSGRRSALARWLTRPDHPLATRVIVNRIWQHHFGQALARSPSDFGVMGDEPTHPELLDWLAAELPRLGWSLKRFHKLLLTSAAYRQASHPAGRGWSSRVSEAAQASWRRSLEEDPKNLLLSRAHRKRREGEAIRDALLQAAGRLSPRRGGPGVMPPLPAEVVSTLLSNQWKVSPDEEDHRRRSIYLFVRRNLRYPFFEAFDRPDTMQSCPQRERSTVAPQALVLLNSEEVLDAARRLAGQAFDAGGPERESWIRFVYRRALSRHPGPEEIAEASGFLEEQAECLRREGRSPGDLALPLPAAGGAEAYEAAALTDFCLALFNSNEFVYVD
jgi:hypothetical protein